MLQFHEFFLFFLLKNRQKEQFSDGVGYSWIDALKATAEKSVSDLQMKFAANRFPDEPPSTKEEYMYR